MALICADGHPPLPGGKGEGGLERRPVVDPGVLERYETLQETEAFSDVARVEAKEETNIATETTLITLGQVTCEVVET